MRLKSAKFRGLIGVYRGSKGLKEIYIDFTKCRNSITLIVGGNGSGKSTIMSALQPLPDNTNMYIPEEEGYKEIEYFHNDIIYKCKIVYPITTTKTRAQTKAFLIKIVDGEETELNPNGNIGSYKDALYNEFNLDPNFVALSQLSTDDRGIVDKTPSERKKFVNNVLTATDVYNNIHKALTKRSTVFRSMINNIVAKIDNIGDEENLKSILSSLENRIHRLSMEKDNITKVLSDNESIIKVTDPDGSIQELYNEVHAKLVSVNEEIDMINKLFLSKFSEQEECYSLDSALEIYKNINNTINSLELEKNNINDKIQTLLLTREEESKSIVLKQQRLSSLTSEFNYDDLVININRLKDNIKKYISLFKEIGIENFNITKDEYIIGLNTLKDLKNMVDTMRSYADLEDIHNAVEYIKNNTDIQKEFDLVNNKIYSLEEEKKQCELKIIEYNTLLKTVSILKQRPSKCNIDECIFIKDALEASLLEPEMNLDICTNRMNEIINEISSRIKEVNKLEEIARTSQSIKIIIRTINNNKSILSKLPNGYIFGDQDIFLNKLLNGSTFDEINDLYKYIDYANIFEQYQNESITLTKLESEFKIYESKNEIIEETSKEIEDITKKLSGITKDIEYCNSQLSRIDSNLVYNRDRLNKINIAIERFKKLDILSKTKKEYEIQISNITNNMEIIERAIFNINQYNTQLININNELKPIIDDKDKIRYSLDRLREYQEELNKYNQKYEFIEVIKKYSSPTKGGIQMVFMKLYMNKTLSIANELLSLFFNGEMEILPYIINENEFRIPCRSLESNIPNDDVSSCSGGQKAIMSMLLSYALLKQSSTKYNILKLDEIDATLDTSNRSNFLPVVNTIMKELDIETCLMVSHSSEIEMSDVDVVWLQPTDNEIPKGNIIFTYSDII